ncbi:alpha-1,2-fucosyltransferase [Curvibacter sp. APW13]|uniref:alpha-1,2-fucosyltransferase n=1 Tax=Curvibacter sp. APW13 TaxID=3077236 RepID=UPI0028DDF400|nr:alpha-1,2-fucosyltransferase [Curvibacter sp. APW13]MDT8991562.1 alpha-1,2-fucosyltransferase [Curvibacter sp. APW13]
MLPKQIILRVEGGLGNQLFQYAAARSLADRLGYGLLLDLRGLTENGDRDYQLNLYSIRAEIASVELLSDLPDFRSSRLGRMKCNLTQAFPKIFSFPVFWPRSFAYDPRFARIRRPVYLVGYWQTEKYFLWNRNQIIRDINLVTPLSPTDPMLVSIRKHRSVALHIRRGDYVTNIAASRFHGLCSLSYYHEAVRDLKQRFADIHVFVFSDEPDWARANLRLTVPTHYVEGNLGHTDLELMRHCQHHVVANSSFSWWGAWLCESAGQIVHAPKRWFSDPDFDTSDVVPSHWLKS